MIADQFIPTLIALEDAIKRNTAADDQTTVATVSVVAAIRVLVLLLDAGFVPPDFVVDPNGEIEMNWMRDRGRWFSLTVASNGDLIYAWILNGNHGNGVSAFDRVTLPLDLTSKLSAVTCETTK